MVNHRRTRQLRAAGVRGLLLSYRDLLVLAMCIVGLLAAWLVYGASAPGNPSAHGAGLSAGTSFAGGLTKPLPTATPRDPDAVAGGGQALPALVPADKPASPLAAGGSPAAQKVVPYPAASAPQRIIYPAAGMDVVVQPLQPDSGAVESQSIVPPETMDGYWLTPFGTPGAGSTNTTYVIGHSWEGLDAPFNHLSSAARAGDEFKVATAAGVMTYKVDTVTTYTKTSLKDSPIWAAVPNQMVLISCYTEDPWGKNVTVVASPVPAP
jgi:hypothetical protein